MDALFARAARLPKVPFAAPERVISQTTDGRAAVGARLRLRGPGRRDRRPDPRRARRRDAPVVATGGLADLIAPHSAHDHRVDQELTLQGLRLVWERNRT